VTRTVRATRMARTQLAQTRMAQTRLALLLGVGVCLTGCASPPAVVGADSRHHTPTVVPAGRVHVLAFVSPECPIANANAPVFADLARRWPPTARRHADDYAWPGTVLLDPHHHLAHRLGITTTPEFAVLTDRGLAYRGRLDDQWRALGSRAPTATQHDLRDAVAAALGGRPVPTPWPEAVGCLLPEPAVE
jgi:hypothetical protein